MPKIRRSCRARVNAVSRRNSRIEFWALAVGYAVIGLSLGLCRAVLLLQMAVQGEIQSFHLLMR